MKFFMIVFFFVFFLLIGCIWCGFDVVFDCVVEVLV